jgi:hypothetical protein
VTAPQIDGCCERDFVTAIRNVVSTDFLFPDNPGFRIPVLLPNGLVADLVGCDGFEFLGP